MTELRQRFGRLIAAHRKRRGLTQEALAASASLSVDMVSRIESGATGARFGTISKLAEALDVDPAQLFSPELAQQNRRSKALDEIVAALAPLSDDDLKWVQRLLEAALTSR